MRTRARQTEHLIFSIADAIALAFALIFANIIRFDGFSLFEYDYLYIRVFVASLVGCILGNLALHLDRRVFDRGLFQEMIAVIRSAVVTYVVALAFLYSTQTGGQFSRLQMGYFILLYILFDYLLHIVIKPLFAKYYRHSRSCRQIMLISSSDKVEQVIEKIKDTNNWYFRIAYICLVDVDRTGETIAGIPVISSVDNVFENVLNLTLDGVFINMSHSAYSLVDIKQLLHNFQSMGVMVHINIDALELDVTDKTVENLGFFKVITYTSKLWDPFQMALKRIMDILGGLVGMIITILVGIVVIPLIHIDSPGPAIYSQIRVGKNGRHFKIYKFRSMYRDADARKAELEKQNEVQGAMFKMTDDPRVTKVGKFIRKYSIDELPQFWNVLIGDMSLVGTRPPTVDEVEKYLIHQKRRLSVTPGMTGIWQTSGRSDIYDFDTVVELDLQYIDQWSIALDIKLILKTILVVFRGSGAK